MKRKQTRFTSEQQILDKIDDTQKRRLALIEEASTCDAEDRLLKINSLVRRIEDSTLPRLKNTLAAFRTEPLKFCGDDKAVVLQ